MLDLVFQLPQNIWQKRKILKEIRYIIYINNQNYQDIRMIFKFKNFLFHTTFNICLFLILLVGIQNSSNKSKVNFLINETIELPVSFIIGTSFISGSILGGLTLLNSFKK